MSFEPTDLGNARRLVDAHGHDLRYAPEQGRWYVWDGRRWGVDITGEVNRRAKAVADELLDEARDSRDEKLFKHAIRSQSNSSLNAAITVATTEPTVPVLVDQLDADPWLLTVANGTLDLAAGRLQAHDRGDLITKTSSVEWHPEATCPTFDAFLERVIPDHDTRRYVQRLAGYSLTGDVAEHCLPILYGHGANGKSTFLEVMMKLLGEHAAPASPNLLVVERHEQHPTALADLAGRRLVVCQEVQAGHRLDESLVKSLTGGDKLKARYMRQDFWSFTPTHKLWLATNHKPQIRGTDDGIWRRIKLIPFEITIPENERDKDLLDHLTEELPGILRWAVQGCIDWQGEGLDTPTAVTEATARYRDESDVVAMFVAECCVTGNGFIVRSSELHTAYLQWCTTNGIKYTLSNKALVQYFDEKGYDRTENRNHQSMWLGIGLLDNRADENGATP